MADDHATNPASDRPALASSRSVGEIMGEFLRKGENDTDAKASVPENGAMKQKEEYTFSASTRAIMERLKLGPEAGADSDSYSLNKPKEKTDLDPPSTRQFVDGDLIKPLDNEFSENSTEPSTITSTQSVPSDDSKNTSEAHFELVNTAFDRLMSDKNKITLSDSYVSTQAVNDVSNIRSENRRLRSLQEIIDDYKSEPSSVNDRPRAPLTMQGTHFSAIGRGGRMNTSQNNETLDSAAGQFDQLRRIGSSVDADGGDYKRALQTKTSYSNSVMSRSRTSMGSFSGLPLASEDKQLQPDREKSESDVDTRSSTYMFARSENTSRESSTDLPGIGFSFQRERERLRNIESIIKKTPTTSYNYGSFGMWKPRRYYQSKFMYEMNPEIQNRRTYSAADYSYTSDLGSTPLDAKEDILIRTASSPTYMGQRQDQHHRGQSSRAGHVNDHTQSSGVDRPGDYYSHNNYSYGMHRTPLSDWSPRSAVHNDRKTLPMHSKNRSYDVKKNRNMSKALTYTNHPTHAKTKITVKPQKKLEVRPNEKRKFNKENIDFNSSRSVSGKKGSSKVKLSKSTFQTLPSDRQMNKDYVPCPHHEHPKYMPYQPKGGLKKSVASDPSRNCLIRCLQSSQEDILPESWAGAVSEGYDFSSNHHRPQHLRRHTASEIALSSEGERERDIPAMPECDELWEEAHKREVMHGCRERDSVARSKSECQGLNSSKQAWTRQLEEDEKVEEDFICDKSSVSAADEVPQPKGAKTKKKIKTSVKPKRRVIKRS